MEDRVISRPDKETVIDLVTRAAPEFLGILADCKDQASWRKMSDHIAEACKRLKIENYVQLYEDERRIHTALLNAVMSKDDQEAWAKEFYALSSVEQQEAIKEHARPGGTCDQIADAMFPDDPEAEEEQIRAFEQMDGSEKREAVKRGQYLLGFFVAWLHDALSVMIHGEKMTSLVPKGLAGDKESFAKAIHIDKNLILNHPGFTEIHVQAIRAGDKLFLEKIVRRLAAPVAQGRIRLAGAFMIFALLETLGWLNEIRHREILDICDAAKIDRWQNRIEDENAVTKALQKYRRYQKTGGVSMH